MARARNIKPSFFKNELLVEMGPFDRLLFIGLWCLADREGRTEDRPKRIKMELFPCDSYDVEQGLVELQRGGFIKRYEAAGVRVIAIANFLKHQTPHGTEKDSQLPDEDGEFTVHERQKNGYSTGAKRKNNVKTDQDNVSPPLDNGEPDVNTQSKNTLNPDSLNPDTDDSYESSRAQLRSDDDVPKSPGEWIDVFAVEHGVEIDHRSLHDRKKFMPLAAGWVAAGVTVGQMRRACAEAKAKATEPIAWLPAYADRVLSTLQAPPRQPTATAETFRERDERLAREKMAAFLPGIAAKGPATTKAGRNVIDITPTTFPAIGA